MENFSEYDSLKNEFYRFLDAVRGLGVQLDKVALGGFIALLAVRNQNLGEAFRSEAIFAASIRISVDEFLKHQLFSRFLDSSVYEIPYEHPSLHRFLLSSEHLILEDDGELLMLLDQVFPVEYSSGQYVTPESIADIMVELIRLEQGQTIFDPAVGTGTFLRAAQNYIRASFSFTAADRNLFCLLIVSLKVYLSGHEDYNQLPGSCFYFADELPKFDAIISNPPVGKMPKDEAKYRYFESLNGIVAQDMTLNFIELSLQHLKENGKAAFLVPMGILFSAAAAERARAGWIQRNLLKMVILLPAGLLYHTSLRCAIVIFDGKNLNKKVRLINAENCLDGARRTKEKIFQLDRALIMSRVNDRADNINVIDVSFDLLQINNCILIPNAYIHGEDKIKDSISDHWEKMGDIADVIQGSSLARLQEGDTPVIRGRDLRVEKLNIDTLAYKNLDGYSKPVVRCLENDILIQRIGCNPAAYLVKGSESGMVVEDTVFIIRFKDAVKEVVSFICDFINSDQVSSRINNARTYSVVATQTLKSIRSLEVPIPDNKTLKVLSKINQLEKSLKKEHEKAEEYKRALFNGDGGQRLNEIVEDAVFTSNALQEALKSKDDIVYRVRTQYPFPLAYAYRHIYLEREYAGIYERQMKYGEQLLSFLAAVGICLAARYKTEGQVDEFTELVKEFRDSISKGISPGHMQAALQKSCKILSQNQTADIALEFSRIWYKSGGRKESDFAKNARKGLVDKLNDFKHHRGPSNKYERKFGSDSQKEILKEMLSHIELCSNWNLLRIDEIQKGWRSDTLQYSASLLKGDHPAFEQIEFETHSKLSKDKLYLDYDGDFICLYPLLSINYNQSTRREEIFTIDKEIGSSFSLKSFDSGSSVTSDDVRSDFEYWAATLFNRKVSSKQ